MEILCMILIKPYMFNAKKFKNYLYLKINNIGIWQGALSYCNNIMVKYL